MIITKFLDPKNDFAFKKIFGTEKNKDILIHFLNDMVTFKEKYPIQEVTFLKPSQDPDTAAKKTSIVDILCRDEKGNQYIVEMQVAKDKGFEKRAQYYAAKAYVSQMAVNGKYEDLKEVIFLAITDFIMFPQRKDYKSEHVILDIETHGHHLRDFSFTFFELPKFHKTIDELTTMVDKWLYFFKHGEETSEKDLPKIIGQDDIIEKVYEELNRFSWNEVEMITYEHALKQEWDHAWIMRGRFNAGEEKGRKEGIEKGREEGRKEGKRERDIEIARILLRQGVNLKVILKATKLSEENIEELAREEEILLNEPEKNEFLKLCES